eukprot:COSAG02_NODE_17883_length_973_cov_2.196796_1_plen_269_part_01
MRSSVERESVESRPTMVREFEKEVPISASGLTYADARYSCSTCGSCGLVVLTWGVLSNEMRDDLSVSTARVVWVLLLLIVLGTSGYLVETVEVNMGVMRPDRRDGLAQKYTTARFQCAGLGVVNVLGLLFGLLANESRSSLELGDMRTGWACFFVMWLLSAFNFIVTMMTTRAQPDPVGEVTHNPARGPPSSPARQAPPRPPARTGSGPVRQSVEGLTGLSSLDRNSLDRDSLDAPPVGARDRSVEPAVVLSSIREERLSGQAHRRSTS